MFKSKDGGRAVISRRFITIRVEVSALPLIVEGAWAVGALSTRFKVTKPHAFAKDLRRALNQEEEDGTTVIHRMFDEAVIEAIENGAEGIEEHEDQED